MELYKLDLLMLFELKVALPDRKLGSRAETVRTNSQIADVLVRHATQQWLRPCKQQQSALQKPSFLPV
jgi:hypothetical protein